MIFRAGTRFNKGDYFETVIDTEIPSCVVTGFIDGEPVEFSGGDDSFQKLIDKSIVIANIPIGTTKIGTAVFQDCINLEQVFIPTGLISVGLSAFRTCNNLKSVIMSDSGVERIDSYAFYSCSSLESVILPDSLKRIDENVFNSCTSLRSITCRAQTPPTLMSNSFNSVPSDADIYVPEQSVEAYKSANNWSRRASYIQAIPE